MRLEPSTVTSNQRENQLSRGITSFYRVIASLTKQHMEFNTVNWTYAKLTHFLRPALASESFTTMIVVADPRRDHEVCNDNNEDN